MRKHPLTNTYTGYYYTEAEKKNTWDNSIEKQFEKGYISDSVFRWNSNNRIPFEDMLTDMVDAGYITREILEKSLEVKSDDDNRVINEYVDWRNNTPYSDEELFEMRAAYGPGKTVTNCFTGKSVTL